MFRKLVAALAAFVMTVDVVSAVEPAAVKTNWSGFRDQLAQRKLNNRNVRITLTSGTDLNARLLRVEQNGIVVSVNDATRQWTSNRGEALVPRVAVSSVQFKGKVGKGGLIGGLAGLGAGAAAVGGSAAGMGGGQCEGPACASVLVLIPAAAVGGWLIGRAMMKSGPVFVIAEP